MSVLGRRFVTRRKQGFGNGIGATKSQRAVAETVLGRFTIRIDFVLAQNLINIDDVLVCVGRTTRRIEQDALLVRVQRDRFLRGDEFEKSNYFHQVRKVSLPGWGNSLADSVHRVRREGQELSLAAIINDDRAS